MPHDGEGNCDHIEDALEAQAPTNVRSQEMKYERNADRRISY